MTKKGRGAVPAVQNEKKNRERIIANATRKNQQINDTVPLRVDSVKVTLGSEVKPGPTA